MERVYRKRNKRNMKGSSRAQNDNKTDKLRVAAYCRVSTDQELQETSLDNQITTYRERINANPDWVLVDIFVDHGISGTRTNNRKGFNKMIQECREGKIDRILTKSISRFARNTVDCLRFVRELSSLNVTVMFEKEGIDTAGNFSEMLLTVMAAFAQEESRSLSENCKWGIRKRFQEGIVRWHDVYGYRREGDETYIVVEEEANVVREIFDLYEKGASPAEIERLLVEKKIPSISGKEVWPSGSVDHILSNDVYAGDIVLQKGYVQDALSHKRVINDGSVVPMYLIRDNHTAIVSHEQFDRVQRIRLLKSTKMGNRYPFDEGVLRCPYCGEGLKIRRIEREKKHISVWYCENCHKFAVSHDDMKRVVLKAIQTRPEFSAAVSPELYMLERCVDHIELGKHARVNDRTLTVFWKNGGKTELSTDIASDDLKPKVLAENIRQLEKRK